MTTIYYVQSLFTITKDENLQRVLGLYLVYFPNIIFHFSKSTVAKYLIQTIKFLGFYFMFMFSFIVFLVFLETSDPSVQKLTVSILTSLLKRIKSNPDIQLPLPDLASLFTETSSTVLRNFALIFYDVGTSHAHSTDFPLIFQTSLSMIASAVMNTHKFSIAKAFLRGIREGYQYPSLSDLHRHCPAAFHTTTHSAIQFSEAFSTLVTACQKIAFVSLISTNPHQSSYVDEAGMHHTLIHPIHQLPSSLLLSFSYLFRLSSNLFSSEASPFRFWGNLSFPLLSVLYFLHLRLLFPFSFHKRGESVTVLSLAYDCTIHNTPQSVGTKRRAYVDSTSENGVVRVWRSEWGR